jgi:hypothetical protein
VDRRHQHHEQGGAPRRHGRWEIGGYGWWWLWGFNGEKVTVPWCWGAGGEDADVGGRGRDLEKVEDDM